MMRAHVRACHVIDEIWRMYGRTRRLASSLKFGKTIPYRRLWRGANETSKFRKEWKVGREKQGSIEAQSNAEIK